MRETVLLATFINHRRKVSSILKLIASNFEVMGDRIFLLKDKKSENDFILTYNIAKKDIVFSDVIRNTISLHRKKDTNTLYTLNALNALVLEQNGELDHNFTVDWSNYNNCILLTSSIEQEDTTAEEEEVVLRRINTELVKVIKLRKEE